MSRSRKEVKDFAEVVLAAGLLNDGYCSGSRVLSCLAAFGMRAAVFL